jgi:nucleoredoxin
MLSEFYQTAQLLDDSKDFEVVFVSSDNSEKEFTDYFGEMPWLAVPYSAKEIRDKLGRKFKVEGIPTLVSLDSAGKAISDDGTSFVGGGKSVNEFFTKPPPVFELLKGVDFAKNDGKDKKSIEDIAKGSEVVGFYFSAHWCGPCRMFTPRLSEAYKSLQGDGKKFEIIFFSSDQDASAMEKYHADMPWYACPFEKQDLVKQLKQRYGVRGIPTLVLVDSTGKLISTSGRGLVELPEEFPWNGPAKPLLKINSVNLDAINTSACLLTIFDSKEACAGAEEWLKKVAEKYVAKFKAERKQKEEEDEDEDEPLPLTFLYGYNEPDSLVERVVGFLNLGKAPAMVISNIPGGKKYFAAAGAEINEAGVTAFIDAFLGDKSKLTEKPIRG